MQACRVADMAMQCMAWLAHGLESSKYNAPLLYLLLLSLWIILLGKPSRGRYLCVPPPAIYHGLMTRRFKTERQVPLNQPTSSFSAGVHTFYNLRNWSNILPTSLFVFVIIYIEIKAAVINDRFILHLPWCSYYPSHDPHLRKILFTLI